jgi:hypothetical protein
VRPEWRLEDIETVVAEFAAAPEGAVVVDPAERAVLVDALYGLARDTSADPLLISGVRIELGLGYLWPTTLHHDLDPLLALPDLLAPFVGWAHGRRGIRPTTPSRPWPRSPTSEPTTSATSSRPTPWRATLPDRRAGASAERRRRWDRSGRLVSCPHDSCGPTPGVVGPCSGWPG